MKHYIIITLLFLSISASAQDFMHSAGIRGGITSGLTYRAYLNPELAYEGIMSFREAYEDVRHLVLAEKSREAFNAWYETIRKNYPVVVFEKRL